MHRPVLIAAALASVSVAALASETITYSYDARGRLVQVAHAGSVNNGVSTSYGLDKADNRTSMTVSGGGSTPPPSPAPASPSVAGSSFEVPEVGSGFQYTPTIAGVVFNAGAGVAGNGSDWGFLPAPDGDQVAFVQSGGATSGSISQTMSGLTGGASYTISFQAAQRPGFSANPISVRYNGVVLGTFTPTSTTFTPFTTSAFIATASSGSVEFVGQTSSTDIASGIDKVTIASGAAPP